MNSLLKSLSQKQIGRVAKIAQHTAIGKNGFPLKELHGSNNFNFDNTYKRSQEVTKQTPGLKREMLLPYQNKDLYESLNPKEKRP